MKQLQHSIISLKIDEAQQIAGFGEEYFGRSEGGESNKLFMQGYKSVLTSKQVEETLVRRRRNQDYVIDWPNHNVLFLNSKLLIYFLQANFARWEPCHGRFRFRHPWQQYLKIGNLSRQCAYRIDALNGFLNSAKVLIGHSFYCVYGKFLVK